jgi:hypothetical protein
MADFADTQAGIVLVDATDDADVGALDADLREAAGALDADLREAAVAWNPYGIVVTRPDPVRPPTIIDLGSIRGLPTALAGLFAAAMVAAEVLARRAVVRRPIALAEPTARS